MQTNTPYRVAAGLVLTAAFLIVWLNAAAGLIGIEDDDPANLLYVAVLAIGFIGALIARLQPRGLARASFATALAQALVGAVALRLPNTASPLQIVILHTVLVAMFAGAGLLFRRAASKSAGNPLFLCLSRQRRASIFVNPSSFPSAREPHALNSAVPGEAR